MQERHAKTNLFTIKDVDELILDLRENGILAVDIVASILEEDPYDIVVKHHPSHPENLVQLIAFEGWPVPEKKFGNIDLFEIVKNHIVNDEVAIFFSTNTSGDLPTGDYVAINQYGSRQTFSTNDAFQNSRWLSANNDIRGTSVK